MKKQNLAIRMISHCLVLSWSLVFFWGCAHHQALPQETYQLAYRSDIDPQGAIDHWAPIFIVYGHSNNYNRIGRPKVKLDEKGNEKITIDTEDPAVYFMKRSFETKKAAYTNLIYRVHFPKTPYSLIPFNLTAGDNVGVMVTVTLNSKGLPVLVTTVHTCGCYKAIVPTQFLPADALPENWRGDRLHVYGEKLPALLNFEAEPSPRIMVHLRPGVHRIMHLEARNPGFLSGRGYRVVAMKAESMDLLNRLPVNGATTSFYHTDGWLKGHVKGAVKPLETIFMSLISLDFFVGTDKAYADARQTGNPFYTSLKPWRRDESDMWDFAGFLWYWGWRL